MLFLFSHEGPKYKLHVEEQIEVLQKRPKSYIPPGFIKRNPLN